MSKPPNRVVKLSETLVLSEFTFGCNHGFWLYDKTRGMNLSMQAKTETDAFVEALTYYQRRLAEVEKKHSELSKKVSAFVDQFTEEE